jgi:hypothetical protein
MTIAQPEQFDLPDFGGKLVALYFTSGTGETGVVMEYVEPRQIGGRLFLTGRMPEASESQWAAKLQGGIAWDSVVHYILFESHEDYMRRFSLGKTGWWSRLFGRGKGD